MMKDCFDPYRKWLGIQPQDQPPHHYRLLGIEPLESDPDVIATAADGRMAQIKNFQTGEHSEASQRILNEIAAAKVCLLNAEKKAAYDRKLRYRLEAEKKGLPEPPPPALQTPEPRTALETAIPEIAASSVISYVAARGRTRRRWQLPLAIGVAGVSIAGLLVFLLNRNDSETTARRPETPREQPADQPLLDIPPPQLPKPEKTDSPTTDPEPVVSQPGDIPSGPQEEPIDQAADPQQPHPAEDPGRTLADLIDPVDPVDPNGPGDGRPGERGPESPQANDPTGPATLPVPDEETRQQAEKGIRAIFQKEFAAAKTPDEQVALAARLFAQARETTDDPTARFVLMQLACRMSAEGGASSRALEMVDQMWQYYDVDRLALKADLLDKAIGAGRPASKTLLSGPQLVDTAMQLIDEAVAADDFAVAGRFAKVAATMARKSADNALLRRITTRKQELDRQRQRFTSAKKALDVLAEEPADAGANLTAGRYYCFHAGNWEKGLPMLAQGNDPVLLELARRDLALPDDPANRLQLADDWWDLAEKQSSLVQPAMQARAAYWYRLALPELAGLDKTRVEKRLERIAAVEQPSTSTTHGVVQNGNVALASNGTTVSGKITWGSALLDGKIEYVGNNYAWADCPSEWTITLDKVYRLQEIRFLLWDRDPLRNYRYVVEISPDGRTFTRLADRSLGKWSSWQRIPFSPRPVKAIKLIGLYGSTYNRFHLIEFEAYCVPPPLLRK